MARKFTHISTLLQVQLSQHPLNITVPTSLNILNASKMFSSRKLKLVLSKCRALAWNLIINVI